MPRVVDDAGGAADAPSALGRPETPGGRGAPRRRRRRGRADRRSARCSRRAGWSRRGRRRSRHAHVASPLAPITAANQTWTTDFKGHFRTGDGVYCYPLTLRDGFSRFVLRCEALGGPTYEATRPLFERAFAEYGLPERHSQRQRRPVCEYRPASAVAVVGLVDAPGHPARAHCARAPGTEWVARAVSLGAQSRHRAAAGRATRGRNSAGSPASAPNTTTTVRTRRSATACRPAAISPRRDRSRAGCRRSSIPAIGRSGASRPSAKSRGAATPLFLSGALAGEDVAFEEVDDGLWTVRFATLALGRYDVRHRRIQPIAPLTEGRSPAALAPRLT